MKPESVAEVIEVEQGKEKEEDKRIKDVGTRHTKPEGLFDENPTSGSAVGVVYREDASGSKIDICSEQCQPLCVSVPPVSSEHDLPTHFSSIRSLKQRGSLQRMRNAIMPYVKPENRGVF
nr:hypothetical protein [Tanacetum cinerariifolium]